MTLRTQLHRIEKASKSIARKKHGDDWQDRFNDAYERGMILCENDIERTVDERLDYLLIKPNHPLSLETVTYMREMLEEGNSDDDEGKL